ncbi:MAG: hypothetical protein HY898_10725 [Deltaproteobacteria bacterium]|nr:hypothetical protein [Deltaproteobacteria bacterium]
MPACSAAAPSDPTSQQPDPVISECTADPPCSGAAADKQGNPAMCVQAVDATVVSSAGLPVSGFHATLCGNNLCKNAQSDADGKLHFSVCQYMFHPALDVPGKSAYVTYAIPIPHDLYAVGPCELVPLQGPGDLLETQAAAHTYSAAGVSLLVDGGTEVQVSEINHPEPDDRKFRAARLPQSAAPTLAQTSPGLELFYGLAPTGSKLAKPARLTVPNPDAWPAGTRVAFYLQGVPASDGGTGAPADWLKVATGQVDKGGATITTETGISYLALVGIKRL